MAAPYHVHGDIAVITLDNPPVNGLDWATRCSVVAGLAQAQQDSAVKAIVITGAGKAFSGGADITEFGTDRALAEPHLHSLILAVEQCSKPVVAAMHSVCMGGGLELSLGCHYRIAAPGCNVALPEVKLGLLPGAGGTQRLPRVVGVEVALNMIVGGDPVKSEWLAALPGQQLFHQLSVSPQSLLDEALAFARSIADIRPLPLVRDYPCQAPHDDRYFELARHKIKATAQNFPAPAKCIDAIEIATQQPCADGLLAERDLFIELMQTPTSRALRHLFFAERAASKIPDVPAETPPRDIQSVAVIGAGTMGSGIAINFLNAGIPVTLLEMKPEALARGVAVIAKNYESQVKKGKLTPEKYAQRMALLSTTLDYVDLQNVDLVIEAVFEDMAVKEQVFRQLDAVMKRGAILASNTSTLDLNRIAGFTQRPQEVVGLHFFSPANAMKLLEVVRGTHTANDVLATVMAVAKKINKTAVLSGVCDGFIGNRMIERYIQHAGFLLDEGCTPAHVDHAAQAFGFAMGPFRMSGMSGMSDLAGNAIGITTHRSAQGITPRQISEEDIVQRLVFSLVNEAAHILEEGIATKASDIDVVSIFGYGFPVHRGGPLHYAKEVGWANVVAAMQRFAQNPLDDAQFWQPAPLLLRWAAAG